MNNLITRAITGAIYVSVLVSIALIASVYTSLLFLVVLLIASNELRRLLHNDQTLLWYTIPVFIYLVYPYLEIDLGQFSVVPTLLLVLPVSAIIYKIVKNEKPFEHFQNAAFSLMYLAIPLASIAFIRAEGVEYFLIAFSL